MFSRKWKSRLLVGINLLVIISMLVGCSTPAVPTTSNTAPMVETHPEPIEGQAPGATTPRPDFLPQDAELIITPVPAPAAPGSEIYRSYSGPTSGEILSRIESQGYVECPEEEVLLLEEGIAYVCPGLGAEMPVMLALVAPAGAIALADGPQPGLADAGAALYIFVSGVALITTGVALSQLPRILMAKNPDILPPLTIPGHIPSPPGHIQNHPSGAYASKLKALAWVAIMVSWWEAVNNGGPDPDWCGRRASDGAMLIVYYGLKIVTLTGRTYEGFGAIVNMGSDAHDSTVLIKLNRPADGQPPSSDNTGRDDFSEFDPIDPSNCPPPPLTVAR